MSTRRAVSMRRFKEQKEIEPDEPFWAGQGRSHGIEKERVVLKHQLKHQLEVKLEVHPLMIGNL